MGSTGFRFTTVEQSSKSISAAVSVVFLILGAIYCVGIYFLYWYSQKYPKALNNVTTARIQLYVPCVYLSLILMSLVEFAISTWLLAQYNHIGFYPNTGTRDGIQLALFSSIWTMLFSIAIVVLLVHPTLSTHPLVSVGSQAIWTLITWCFWVACTATLNRALPLLTMDVSCAGSVFCSQLQGAFAFAIINLLILSLGILALAWLIWRISHHSKNTPPL